MGELELHRTIAHDGSAAPSGHRADCRTPPICLGRPEVLCPLRFLGQGLFSASGAIECRLREALRVKTWCRRSQNVGTHLPRGPGNYGCHRSRPWCHSGCAGFLIHASPVARGSDLRKFSFWGVWEQAEPRAQPVVISRSALLYRLFGFLHVVS